MIRIRGQSCIIFLVQLKQIFGSSFFDKALVHKYPYWFFDLFNPDLDKYLGM